MILKINSPVFLLALLLATLMNLEAQTPAGNNQEVQFNSNGSFGASPYLKWNGMNLQFLDLGAYSAKLYFKSETGDDSYIFSENYGPNQNRLVFHTRDDGDQDYAVFRNRHWNDGEKDVFEIHRTWTKANSNFYVMNGNVGIGTTTPDTRLYVYEESVGAKTLLTLEKHESDIQNNSEINFDFTFSDGNNNGKPQARISAIANTDISKGSGMEAEGTADMKFWTANANNSTSNILSERMRITSLGNVGIGTTTPDSKLTVAGNIHAQEVKVTINAGADFVFNTDYNLPKLEDVEQFIKENKHLPEIASEKEMQEKGLHLAEMNIKLLQKIEELTLYTIQQEKKIEILENEVNRINKLEKENEQLKILMQKLIKNTND